MAAKGALTKNDKSNVQELYKNDSTRMIDRNHGTAKKNPTKPDLFNVRSDSGKMRKGRCVFSRDPHLIRREVHPDTPQARNQVLDVADVPGGSKTSKCRILVKVA